MAKLKWLAAIAAIPPGIMLYFQYVYKQDPTYASSRVPPFGEIGKQPIHAIEITDSYECDGDKLINLKTTNSWSRNKVNARNVITARDSNASANDHVFEYQKDKKNWSYFVSAHYDWYMFPWKAKHNDSKTANKYSLLEGDVVDLILTQNFMDRYINSIETLIKCKNESIHDPINSIYVHPARHSKLLCSIQYFINIAQFIGDDDTLHKLNELKTRVIDTFDDIDCELCNGHIWQNSRLKATSKH